LQSSFILFSKRIIPSAIVIFTLIIHNLRME
jgi:hypothetical protein